MTVLLVLVTFSAFLLIDYFRSRHAVVKPALQVSAAKADAVPRPKPALVGGFEVPENLRYHPGHTWALRESSILVRVGMDDFASKLTGILESITLPTRGQWIRQGQKMCTLHRDGAAVDMVSPIEGTISDINEAVVSNPKLALSDPYGEGWLLTVQAPDAKTSFATCWAARWPAGGPKNPQAVCNAECQRPLPGRSHRMAESPWRTSRRISPTQSGRRWRRNSSCHNHFAAPQTGVPAQAPKPWDRGPRTDCLEPWQNSQRGRSVLFVHMHLWSDRRQRRDSQRSPKESGRDRRG